MDKTIDIINTLNNDNLYLNILQEKKKEFETYIYIRHIYMKYIYGLRKKIDNIEPKKYSFNSSICNDTIIVNKYTYIQYCRYCKENKPCNFYQKEYSFLLSSDSTMIIFHFNLNKYLNNDILNENGTRDKKIQCKYCSLGKRININGKIYLSRCNRSNNNNRDLYHLPYEERYGTPIMNIFYNFIK